MIKRGVTYKPRKRGGAVTKMNALENSQLMMEVSILREYFSINDQGEYNRHKRSGKFKIEKGVFNPIPIKYLVQHDWGLGSSYLFSLDKRMKKLYQL